jgi:hypothetical protein
MGMLIYENGGTAGEVRVTTCDVAARVPLIRLYRRVESNLSLIAENKVFWSKLPFFLKQ